MADKILYVSGYNIKKTTQHMLEELFIQAGPIRSVIMYETRAQVCFQDAESIPYCLALFQGLELHGNRLKFQVKYYRKDTNKLIHDLADVRNSFRQYNLKIPPPDLPPKKHPTDEHSKPRKRNHSQLQQGGSSKNKRTKHSKVRQSEVDRQDNQKGQLIAESNKQAKRIHNSPAKKVKKLSAKSDQQVREKMSAIKKNNKKKDTKKRKTFKQR